MEKITKVNVENLKLFNIFGTVTITADKAIALAVSVLPGRESVERTATQELRIAGLEGVHQVLFGAMLRKRGAPEIAVFQLEAKSSAARNLVDRPEIQSLLNRVVASVQENLQ